MTLGFQVEWAGVVSFDRSYETVGFSADDKLVEFKIPLVGSNDETIRNAKIRCSEEINFVSTEILKEEGKWVLKSKFVPYNVKDIEILGEMIVASVEGNESNLLLTLRREQSVSILPSKIMMIPTADKDKGISLGRSILKIRSRSPGEEVTIRRLTCETSDGEDLDVSFNRLTNETFRVEVRIKDVEKLPSGERLKWTLVVGSGETYTLFTTHFDG